MAIADLQEGLCPALHICCGTDGALQNRISTHGVATGSLSLIFEISSSMRKKTRTRLGWHVTNDLPEVSGREDKERGAIRPGCKGGQQQRNGGNLQYKPMISQRFVRMQESPDIGKFTYTQQHWVNVQAYQSEPWSKLVEFWYLYNSHLAHVIAHADPGSLEHVCGIGYAKPATLRFVMEDYVRHVEHHLKQILSGADPMKREKWVSREPQ